jgi:hypothetical protein
MEILVIMLLLGIGAGVKTALDHTADGYRQSRASAVKAAEKKAAPGKLSKSRRAAVAAHHAQGWWLSELFHGLPVARTGWHAGWLSNKAAADHGKAIREEARTTHLETRASVLSGIPEHRKRQAEARKQIEGILTTEPNAKGKKAVRKAADAVVLPFRPRADAPLPSETVNGGPEPGPYAKPTRRADGLPETEVDTRFFDLRESGYTGPINQDGRKPDMSDPQEAEAVGILDRMRQRAENEPGADAATWSPETIPQESPSPATNGSGAQRHDRPTGTGSPDIWTEDANWTPVPTDQPPATNGASTMPATDTTYTDVINTARAALAQSDQDTVSIRGRKEKAYADADEMVAAHVDPAVIDAQMSYADSLARAEEALAGAGEHAGATASTLERYHGGVQEAVSSAPGQVAERQFHEGS